MQDELLSILADEPSGSVGFSIAWTRLNLRLGTTVPRAEFEQVVNALTAKKAVTQKGGGEETRIVLVGRAPPRPEAAPPVGPAGDVGVLVDQGDVPESALMGPLLSWIGAKHAPTFSPPTDGRPTFVVADTSKSGVATGVWSRPDVTVASVRRHQFSSLRYVELTGYELKRAGEGSVVAVHEALAHKRWVHRAYLVVFAPRGYDDPKQLEDIQSECARHGVGLITFTDITDHAQYRELLQPRKDAVDPSLIDDFILKRMDGSVADLVRMMEA